MKHEQEWTCIVKVHALKKFPFLPQSCNQPHVRPTSHIAADIEIFGEIRLYVNLNISLQKTLHHYLT